MSRPLIRGDGVFQDISEARLGDEPDLSMLSVDVHAPELVSEARSVWQERFRTEFRSIQIMTRFLTEVLGAGDPLEVYACCVELVEDEIRHTRLCAAVCRALGVQASFPDPVELVDSPTFVRAPMAERALCSAVSMLVINETISTGFIEDLRERCTYEPIHAVLAMTAEDESEHEAFGVEYVRRSLERFPPSARIDVRHLVRSTLEPHRARAAQVLRSIPGERRALEHHPDDERAQLGLFSAERQALVFERTMRDKLLPRLALLDLVD